MINVPVGAMLSKGTPASRSMTYGKQRPCAAPGVPNWPLVPYAFCPSGHVSCVMVVFGNFMFAVGGSARTVRPDDIARDLGIAPFQVRKARGQLSGWTGEGVAQAIAAVAVADEQIKGAGTDPVFALEQAIGAIVAARSRRD